MKIGIIGGGGVGQTLGSGLVAKGHQVTVGIRNVTAAELAKPRSNAAALGDWAKTTGAKVATIAEAAAGADLIINASHGEASIAALTLAGAANLADKVLIDVANPLDFSQGMPPALTASFNGHTSLGEQIQAAFPKALVVKAFNTIAAPIMINPGLVKGDHDLFIAGNDTAAKATVTDLVRAFGWTQVVDLGGITAARGTESYLLFWAALLMSGGPIVNIHVHRG